MAQASITVIGELIKTALKNKETEQVATLRMLLAALRNKKIALGNKKDLTEEEIISVVASEIKKRKDSFATYSKAGRKDLADKELAEIQILEKFQPKQMSDEEVEAEVGKVVEELKASGPADFSKVMGQVITRVKGRADGQKVSRAVKKILI